MKYEKIRHCLVLVLILLIFVGFLSTDVHADTIASGTTGAQFRFTVDRVERYDSIPAEVLMQEGTGLGRGIFVFVSWAFTKSSYL